MDLNDRIHHYLQQRKENHLYRKLTVSQGLVDFSSNDYLGFSRSAFLHQQVTQDLKSYQFHKSGATGSRLLNGNSALCEELEQLLAEIHHAEAALLYTSGFDANVGLISTVARPGDVIFYDELVHASIHQGMLLSGADLVSYAHNDMEVLENMLKGKSDSKIGFIITESVFSMEGDKAHLAEIAALAHKYKVELVVDEAHAAGLFGTNGSGLCNQYGMEDECFARVITFGKAIGSHGAAVVGGKQLKEYLVNFSRNFIYTTGLDTGNLLSVKHAYLYLQNNVNQVYKLVNLNKYFTSRLDQLPIAFKVRGEGPIFGIVVGENRKCRNLAAYVQQRGLDVRAILSPTVPIGTERLRVILHSFNTEEQIEQLFSILIDYQ